jgi:tetratricopeptide (TPR) repeat protein
MSSRHHSPQRKLTQAARIGFVSIGVHSWFLLSSVSASPLDDRIAAFKEAPTQTENAVSDILDNGLKENRSALAFAAVKPWLSANPSESQTLLHRAAQSAEYAGDWTAATSFYRKLLKADRLDGRVAAEAVPACYRLLISHLGDPEAAYLFMRDEGARLRGFGDARKFDSWFLSKASERKDLIGLAKWLTAIHNTNDPLGPYSDSLEVLLGELETFGHGGEDLFTELKNLEAAKQTSPAVKARLNWVMEIVPFAGKMADFVGAKRESPGSMMNDPLKAAEALIAAAPYEGAVAVAKGWMHFNAGDSGVFSQFVAPRRAEKAAPLLQVLRKLPADQARALLGLEVVGAKGRKMAQYLPTQQELRALVAEKPEIFNSLAAPDVPLFDNTLTPEEAKAMAPSLARNPHLHAALIRAFAQDERRYGAVVDAAMKTEMWRFSEVKDFAHSIWHSGMFERGDEKFEAALKKHANFDARYQQLQKQVSEKASSKDRMAAFNSLQADLLGNSPVIPGALALWNELFSKSADEDTVTMVKSMTSDLSGDRLTLLQRAIGNITFGKAGKLVWQVEPTNGDNHYRHHQKDTRAKGAELITYLENLVKAQMKSGNLSEPIFGMWIHSVDPNTAEAKAFIAELRNSPAYAKLPLAYRQSAADSNHFGYMAMTTDMAATNPRHVSRQLLDLPENPQPEAVEAALNAAIDTAAKAPAPVAVLGLGPVAALPEWSDQVRSSVLSLFKDLSPIGNYPSNQGYEQLIQRLAKEAAEKDQLGMLEPYSAGLWQAAASPDDNRLYPGADALAGFAERAQDSGSSSIAMTVARGGVRSQAGRAMASSDQAKPTEIIASLGRTVGKAAADVGAVEIPVDPTDPAFPIYKSNSEFILGNLDSAWNLYVDNAEQLPAVLRNLSVEYGFWLLLRNTETGRTDEAEDLVKELTIWSRQAEGTFSPEQEARLKISYADLAFLKGALPTSRAWYRKVAEAAEYENTEMQLIAALGSVKVDRVSKDFGAAMTELDKLIRLKNPDFRKRVRYSRAEVFMDQESYAEALDEIEAVLREEPKHPDALILRGKIHYEMRKLVEASEIELGPSQDDTVLVPGEMVKINLRDPTLSVSGVGADIEVEIWAKSGDKERVLLYQLGDSKEKFRAEIPTALGPPTPGDKILQILGDDEIRFGYSERFRAKMDDLPEDPDIAISVASDAYLSFSAGAFPPREGERKLDIEELGLSTAQAALGMRAVRPGNPVYLRITDPDRSLTPGIDEITVSLQASSGDEIRQLILKETSPFSGEFEAVVPTTGAQALAFASESAPGRDPNMAISSKDYPGWQGQVGEKSEARIFGIDLNDNAAINKMTIDTGESGLTHFVLQTSMNGKEWTTRSRYPEHVAPWDGRPRITSFPTYTTNSGAIAISDPKGYELPDDWLEKMELTSARQSKDFLAATVKSLSAAELPVVSTGHPGYSGLIRYRALFYQPAAAIRKFKLTGYPLVDGDVKIQTIFLLDGEPADEETEDPLTIERELAPGLHEIEIWRHEGRDNLLKRKPVLLCDEVGKDELVPCPDGMFDPTTFPEGVRSQIPQPAVITAADGGGLEVAFGDKTQARLVRMVILGFEGVAPTVKKITLSDREGTALLPVDQDYRELRENTELEVLPGDEITARYEDPVSATPKRTKHEKRLTVAFNDAVITASFLNYEENKEGERVLVAEPIRRFRLDDAVGIIIDDADLDSSPERDTIEISVTSSSGETATLTAVETEEHSGRFMGRVFPVEGEPSRSSEIKITPGGTLTAIYRDVENLDPGIPTDRTVTVSHAVYSAPALAAYVVGSEEKPAPVEKAEDKKPASKSRASAPEIVRPRRSLDYSHLVEDIFAGEMIDTLIGAPLRFDVVAPHLALAKSSEIRAYVQTDAARKAAKLDGGATFDVRVPGTLKLTGTLGSAKVEAPAGYTLGTAATPPTNEPPLEEGRFSFAVPLILGDPPDRSFATSAAAELPSSSLPDGLAVKAGDIVHIGFPWQDEDDKVHWKTASFTVGSHAFLDVMENGYSEDLDAAFVGEKVYLRLIAPGLDRGPERDATEVTLKGTSGVETKYQIRETESHSGVFKGVFTIAYADEKLPSKLPPVELNGFPVRYGDNISVSYENQSYDVTVNKGADGMIEPFTKRFTGDEMAVRTGFTLAECFFELAKKHREMDQESLARREIGHARKLLAEALANHQDPELKAHAEYLLGNLAQEYADLAKNDEAKLPMYQDALARFSKIPSDYPESEFASKAQFKTALVYEKMGEIENSVEEYVKLAYKYPDDELIPTVMARLGGYFQAKGMIFKKQADPFREKEDLESKAETLKFDELSYPEFLNAAMVFSKLHERFPDDPLAGLAGLRAAQNYMRAHQYDEAIGLFDDVVANEEYDDREIRSQALYWSGISNERVAGIAAKENYKQRGTGLNNAYQIYRRVTFDFPDSKWAKYARGRLADPTFADIAEKEAVERERMIEAIKESR